VISGATLVLAAPLAAAVLVHALRRWTILAVGLAALVSTMLALITWNWLPRATVILPGISIEMGRPVALLGQQLTLTTAARPLIVLTCSLAAACFCCAAAVSQGRSFPAMGLVLLSAFNAAALTQPLIRAPLALAVSSTVAVFIIQGGRAGPTRAATRWLLFGVLAFPFFLVAAWYLGQIPLNPDNLAPLSAAARLMALGLLFLLMAVPLHGAVIALTSEAPPLAGGFVLLGSNALGFFLLSGLLHAYPWLADYYDISGWLIWLGLATVGWTGLLAAGQNRFGPLWGYATLYDFGCFLVALGLGGPLGLSVALSLLAVRCVGLILGSLGLAVLRQRADDDSFAGAGDVARRIPWSIGALLAGGLAMAGLPLTASFPAHWALLQYLGQEMPRAAIVVVLGASGVAAGYIRGLSAILKAAPGRHMAREAFLVRGLVAVLLLLSLLLCFRPQGLSALITSVAEALATVSQVTP
jgi:formate hydrogenlyase subunit 3/multisubunit Na+/H+ antiporter MnhD subunit